MPQQRIEVVLQRQPAPAGNAVPGDDAHADEDAEVIAGFCGEAQFVAVPPEAHERNAPALKWAS